MSVSDYVCLTGDEHCVNLRPCKIVLRSFNGGIMKTRGKVSLELKKCLDGSVANIVCHVVEECLCPVLSLQASVDLGLLT